MPNATPIVFIVDDDVSVRESLELLIRSAGWRPETFASAEEFLANGAVEQTRCLILDIAMPGMTGFDLQQELERRRQEIPIVFITAFADETVRSRALAAGAVECLSKPFSETALLDAVATALRRK